MLRCLLNGRQVFAESGTVCEDHARKIGRIMEAVVKFRLLTFYDGFVSRLMEKTPYGLKGINIKNSDGFSF